MLGAVRRQMGLADRYRMENTRRVVEAKSWKEFREYCSRIETARDSIFRGMACERELRKRLGTAGSSVFKM